MKDLARTNVNAGSQNALKRPDFVDDAITSERHNPALNGRPVRHDGMPAGGIRSCDELKSSNAVALFVELGHLPDADEVGQFHGTRNVRIAGRPFLGVGRRSEGR